MQQVKFRQPIFKSDGTFQEFHYWGLGIIEGGEIANVGYLTYKLGITDPKQSQQYIGLKDKDGVEIYEGDIGEVKTESGDLVQFTVRWGIHRREMASGWQVDIPSFAFMVGENPTFPITDNYMHCHDLDIIKIVGNVYQQPV